NINSILTMQLKNSAHVEPLIESNPRGLIKVLDNKINSIELNIKKDKSEISFHKENYQFLKSQYVKLEKDIKGIILEKHKNKDNPDLYRVDNATFTYLERLSESISQNLRNTSQFVYKVVKTLETHCNSLVKTLSFIGKLVHTGLDKTFGVIDTLTGLPLQKLYQKKSEDFYNKIYGHALMLRERKKEIKLLQNEILEAAHEQNDNIEPDIKPSNKPRPNLPKDGA
ncbi:MAG: hypothetical protein JWM09_462, partial [Francisellaceae bacterium]|nr:hypothetical protein [Francisellaceae bacterium]